MIGFGLRKAEAIISRFEWIDRKHRTYTPGISKGREADRPLVRRTHVREHLDACRVAAGDKSATDVADRLDELRARHTFDAY
jgi:integrase/recombinase XerC